MRSTALEGTLSKIVTKHEAGTMITIPRYLADTIVTEYGVARLLDKNHRQRAEETDQHRPPGLSRGAPQGSGGAGGEALGGLAGHWRFQPLLAGVRGRA